MRKEKYLGLRIDNDLFAVLERIAKGSKQNVSQVIRGMLSASTMSYSLNEIAKKKSKGNNPDDLKRSYQIISDIHKYATGLLKKTESNLKEIEKKMNINQIDIIEKAKNKKIHDDFENIIKNKQEELLYYQAKKEHYKSLLKD